MQAAAGRLAAAAAGGWGAAAGLLAPGSRRGLLVRCASWRHRNPFDMDELGSKSLSDGKALMSIDEVEHQRKRDDRSHEEAKEAAIKLLAARPHSQKELRTKLMEKGFGMELIKDAIDRLHELVGGGERVHAGAAAGAGRKAGRGSAAQPSYLAALRCPQALR